MLFEQKLTCTFIEDVTHGDSGILVGSLCTVAHDVDGLGSLGSIAIAEVSLSKQQIGLGRTGDVVVAAVLEAEGLSDITHMVVGESPTILHGNLAGDAHQC